MGNKSNRNRRKKRFSHISNLLKRKNTASSQNDKVTTDGATVVDLVSVLCPISDAQDNYTTSLDQDTPTAETNIHDDVQDPLFVLKSDVKTELISHQQPIEFSSIGSTGGSLVTKLKIEPISNDDVKNEPSGSTEFKNMCRLCLARDECAWIEIFSNEPYDGVDDITPSNIAAIIEQSTTVKISENDNLPKKLCSQCFESLRFAYQFREKSMSAQHSLNSMGNSINQSFHEQRELNVAATDPSQPMKRLVKIVHLKRIPKPKIKRRVKPADHRKMELQNARVVQCELCGKVFEKSVSLQYHLNRHNNVRPFACTEPFCDKSFYSPMNRKSHVRNTHCLVPRFKCDLCEKAYNKADRLKFHRTIHFPPTIPCNICGKLLRSQATVYKHQASHAERRFKCDDCEKSFQNAYTLNVHRRIHTNEKPFVCCKCGEAFAHNCLLKAHTDRKHSD